MNTSMFSVSTLFTGLLQLSNKPLSTASSPSSGAIDFATSLKDLSHHTNQFSQYLMRMDEYFKTVLAETKQASSHIFAKSSWNMNFSEDASMEFNVSASDGFCVPDVPHEEADLWMFFLLLTSCILLLFTSFVYLSLPELRNLHGKCILGHILSLSAFFLLSSVEIRTKPTYRTNMSTLWDGCWVLGFFMYVSSLMANLWLVAINLDIFRTFRTTIRSDPVSSAKRFKNYCIIIFLTTIIISSILPITESLLPDTSLFKPKIGCTRCWLPTPNLEGLMSSTVIYHYIILGLIFIFNLVTFVMTNYYIWKAQASIQSFQKKTKIKSRMLLFFKLFCVTGTTWSISLGLWIANSSATAMTERNTAVRSLELFNVSHGFCYFIVFVCKPSIFKKLRKKWFTEATDGKIAASSNGKAHQVFTSTTSHHSEEEWA